MYHTCTQISSRAARISLEQHTLWGHFCSKSSMNVVNKILTVRAVHPDSFTQRVLNVNLKVYVRRTNYKKSSCMTEMCLNFVGVLTLTNISGQFSSSSYAAISRLHARTETRLLPFALKLIEASLRRRLHKA